MTWVFPHWTLGQPLTMSSSPQRSMWFLMMTMSVRSWRESWESSDFRFSRPLEFVPVIQALAKVLDFKPPAPTTVQDNSQFSVFATSSSRTVVVPTPWESDQVVKAATQVDDHRVVKEATSFGDSALAKFFPLSEDDEALLKVVEMDNEVVVYMRSIFLVAKESGSWRPILNLKAFNKFVVPPSFWMETLRTVMDCLGEAAQQRRNTSEHLRDSSLSETTAISINLRDAYFHMAVAPEHTRYLRFAYNGRAFEYLVLPFGLSTAPRVFTRIVRVIETFLKVQGVDMHQYLEDWLMKSQSKSLVERHRDLTLFWVNKLGFLVNKKSPSSSPLRLRPSWGRPWIS